MSRFGWAFVNDVIIGTGSAGTGSAVDGAVNSVVVKSGGIVSGATNFIFNNATGFGQLTGSLGITNNLSVTGSLSAGPASVVSLNATTYVSASSVTGTLRSNTGNKFGSSAGDVHQFTGSISAGIVSGTTAQFTTVTGSTLTSSVLYANTATIPTITSTNITNSNNVKTFVLNVTGASNSVISGKDLSSLGSAASSNQIQLSPLSIEYVDTFYIKPDGSKIYLHNSDISSHEIVICNLATPWDISTISLDSRFLSSPAASSVASGFTFKPDGTKAYILATAGTTVQRLYETSLSNPWQLDASSVWSAKVLLTGSSGTLTEQQGISISEDGRYLFTCSGSGINNTLIRYTMSQPWDASSITATSYDTASITLNAVVSDIAVSNDGKSILILDSNDNLYDFELQTPYSLTTVTQKSSILLTSLLPSRKPTNCMFLKPDQTKIFFHTTDSGVKYFSSLTMSSSQVDLVGGIHITGDAKITQNINVYGDATFEDLSGSNAQFRILSGSLVNLTTVTGSSISSSIGQFAQLTASSADINGGTIDNATIATSNITVGASKTLDVSAGTLTLGAGQITADKIKGGTFNTTISYNFAGSTISNLGSVTTADINGGTIDGTSIGASSQSTGKFTSLSASLTLDVVGKSTVTQLTASVGISGSQGQFAQLTASSIAGNSATATKLATARNINGTAFDGTADITTTNWGTARTITIGNTGKSVNGSTTYSWTVSEIGAAGIGTDNTYSRFNTFNNYYITASVGITGSDAKFTTLTASSANINGGTIDVSDPSATLTLRAAQITADKIAGGTFGAGTYSFSGRTISNLGSVTTADINGGTIDNTSIGATVQSTGKFTTLSASSTLDIAGNTSLNGLVNGLTLKAVATNTTILGNGALSSTTPANYNTAIGASALANNTTGLDNTAVGSLSLTNNTTAQGNVAVGANALRANTTGQNNVAIGFWSASGSNGSDNVAIGAYALYNGSSDSSIGIGRGAGLNNTGDDNIFIGKEAGLSNTSAIGNILIGTSASYWNDNGSYNIVIGYGALKGGSTAGNPEYNVAIGHRSLENISTGDQNVSVGALNLGNLTSGYNNTAIGYANGSTLITGYNNTLIGYNAEPAASNTTNSITLGDANIVTLRCADTTISTLSDRRDKKNIEDLPVGLNFINELRPVKFDWETRDGSKIGQKSYGFIAQELDEAQQKYGNEEYLRLVLKDNPDKLEAAAMRTYPVLVKAVQELSELVQELRAEIEILKNK